MASTRSTPPTTATGRRSRCSRPPAASVDLEHLDRLPVAVVGGVERVDAMRTWAQAKAVGRHPGKVGRPAAAGRETRVHPHGGLAHGEQRGGGLGLGVDQEKVRRPADVEAAGDQPAGPGQAHEVLARHRPADGAQAARRRTRALRCGGRAPGPRRADPQDGGHGGEVEKAAHRESSDDVLARSGSVKKAATPAVCRPLPAGFCLWPILFRSVGM